MLKPSHDRDTQSYLATCADHKLGTSGGVGGGTHLPARAAVPRPCDAPAVARPRAMGS